MSFKRPVVRGMTMIGRSEDEREPAEKKPEPTHKWVARCTSDNCIYNSFKTKTRAEVSKCLAVKGVVKDGVKFRKTFCPDCGYALCWSRDPIGRDNSAFEKEL